MRKQAFYYLDPADRQEQGWLAIEEAYAADDADQIITEGDWAGFTRACAISWCWNLYQYEPRGFVHPGTQLRAMRVDELVTGGIPNGFGYADRARELEALGTTPKLYRLHKEAFGAKTFTPADVTFVSSPTPLPSSPSLPRTER